MPLSAETIRRAIDDPDRRQEVRVSLTVSGGLAVDGAPAQPFSLNLRGLAESGMAEMAVTHFKSAGRTNYLALLGEERMVGLLQALDGDALAKAQPKALIPPDSLVGRLEVAIGDETEQIVFMADEEQARTAEFELPPAVAQFVDQLMEISRNADPSGAGSALDPA